jgi:hypothetical protein
MHGIFVTAFRTLFTTSIAMFGKPRFKSIEIKDYALHLLRYYNIKFGKHLRFFYYLYNLMMHHCAQAIAFVFVKKNIEENFPTIIIDLNICLEHFPGDKLAEKLMCFEASLHGTRSFWHKSRNEIIDMISYLGRPTFLFTLSAIDTKYLELHAIMPDNPPTNVSKQQHW